MRTHIRYRTNRTKSNNFINIKNKKINNGEHPINNLKNIRNKIPKDFISSLQSHAKNCNINTFHFIMGEIMGNMEDHSNGSMLCYGRVL